MLSWVSTTRMTNVRLPLALCLVFSLPAPLAAYGQPGKQLDPDSPAGVEYQLPLEQARKNATGGGEKGPNGGGEKGPNGGGEKGPSGGGEKGPGSERGR